MGAFTVVGWSTLILCSLMSQTFTQTYYGDYTMLGQTGVNSKHVEVKSNGIKQPDGKCRYSVLGRGVSENAMVEDCASNFMGYSQINIDNYYAFFYPDRQPFTLYTDAWGTLVIVKGTGCTLRTYETSVPKEVTLSREICDKINKKIDDEIAQVTEYWRKWQINFDLKMKKLPPAEVIFDPLKNQPPTPSLYAGQPGVPVSAQSPTSTTGQHGGVTFGENGSMNFGSPSGDDDSDEDEAPTQTTQPLTPSLPAQHIPSPTTIAQAGGPTILGETSMEYNGDSSIHDLMMNVVTNKFNNDNGCELQKIVKGNGVYDIFKMPCPEKSLSSLTNNGLIILGHPNIHPFSVFSDEPATLYLFERGSCSKKTYTSDGWRVNSKVEFLAPIDCPGLKGRIRDSLRKSGLYFNKAGSLNFGSASNGDDADVISTIIQPTQTTGPTMPNQPTNPYVTTQPLTPNLPSQPLTPNLPSQPLTPNQPSQPITTPPATTQGGRTILGQTSMESKDQWSLNRDTFNVYGDVGTSKDGTMKKCIEGRRVHDCFIIPRAYKKPGSIAMSGYVVMGHPNTHPFSVFSDEPATLYLFENGMCTKKTYTTQGGVTTGRAQFLSDTECVAAKEKMEKSLKRNNIVISPDGSISMSMSGGYAASEEDEVSPSTPTDEQPATSDDYDSDDAEEIDNTIKVSTNFPPKKNGQCEVEITVEGNGVEDTFREPCSAKAADYLTTEDVFVFGYPGKNSLSLYSNEPEILYVVKNKICTKKTYETTDGVTTSKRSPLRLAKCNEIKKTIANTLKSQKSSLQQPISLKPVTPTSVNRPSLVTPSVNTPTSTLGTSLQPLKQFEPTNPLPLGNDGINSDYNMQAVQNTDNSNGECYFIIKAKGNEVNDQFQVTCSNENNRAISAKNFMLFGSPTSTLGLYSDTPSTLIIMNKGTCYKKTYGRKPTGPTLIGGSECEEIKKRMLKSMSLNDKVINEGLKVSGSGPFMFNGYNPQPTNTNTDEVDEDVNGNSYTGSTPVSLKPQFNGIQYNQGQGTSNQNSPSYPDESNGNGNSNFYTGNTPVPLKPQFNGIQFNQGTTNQNLPSYTDDSNENVNGNSYTGSTPVSLKPQFNGIQYNQETTSQSLPSYTSPESLVADASPIPSETPNTALGVSWREANFNDVYFSQFNVKIKNIGGGQCTIKIVGRGVNEMINEKISVMGDNIQKYESSYILALADPSKQSGIYTADWGELVFVRNGECYKKKYNTEFGEHTKIKTSRMTASECEAVKDSISPALGVTFGQQKGSSPSASPTWRKGNYQSIYNARPTVTITKNNNGPQDCKIAVSFLGRALNDEIVGDCSVFGTNIQKRGTSYSMAVADPSSNSGFYTEDWGKLVVITKGQCTTRTYDSSPITHTTKITTNPNPLSQAQCNKVKERISGLLGANFGY